MFDIVDNSEVPIRFGHSKEEREELMKHRSVDELMDIIKEYDLEFLVVNAVYNNDFGYGCIRIDGHLERKDDKILLISAETVDLKEHFGDEAEQIFEEYQKYNTMFFISKIGEGDDEEYSYYAFSTDKEDAEMEAIMTNFLEMTETDSLHKLGKIINRGAVLFNEWYDKNKTIENIFGDVL